MGCSTSVRPSDHPVPSSGTSKNAPDTGFGAGPAPRTHSVHLGDVQRQCCLGCREPDPPRRHSGGNGDRAALDDLGTGDATGSTLIRKGERRATFVVRGHSGQSGSRHAVGGKSRRGCDVRHGSSDAAAYLANTTPLLPTDRQPRSSRQGRYPTRHPRFAHPSNKDVGDPPESCVARWSTSARASQHCGHDALVTAEFC